MELDIDQRQILRGEVYLFIKENNINTITIRDLCEAKFRIRYKGCVLPPTQRLLISILDDLKSSGYVHQVNRKSSVFFNANDYSKDYEDDNPPTEENSQSSDEDEFEDENFSEISEIRVEVAGREVDEKNTPYDIEDIEIKDEFLKSMSDDVSESLPGNSGQGVIISNKSDDSNPKKSKRRKSPDNAKQRKRKTQKDPLESVNPKALERFAAAGVYVIDGKVVRDDEALNYVNALDKDFQHISMRQRALPVKNVNFTYQTSPEDKNIDQQDIQTMSSLTPISLDSKESKGSKKKLTPATMCTQQTWIQKLPELSRQYYKPSVTGIICDVCGPGSAGYGKIRPNSLFEHNECRSHVSKLHDLLNGKLRQTKYKDFIKNNTSDSTLNIDQKSFRFGLVKTWLNMNISMIKLDFFSSWLRDHVNHSIPNSSNLSKDYIPLISRFVIEEILLEIKDRLVSIIFDGTMRRAENFCLIIRYVYNRRWAQKLVYLGRYDKSFTGDKLAAVLLNVLLRAPTTPEVMKTSGDRGGLGLVPNNIVNIIGDRSSTNLNAIGVTGTSFVFRNFLNDFFLFTGCFSHTGTHAAEQIFNACTTFYEFWHTLVGTLSRSSTAQSSFKRYVKKTYPRWSKTRWFGERDAIACVMDTLQLVVEWVFSSETEFENSTERSNYQQLRRLVLESEWGKTLDGNIDPNVRNICIEKWFYIKLEMALIVDGTVSLRRMVYNLEGNYPVAFCTFDEVEIVSRDFEFRLNTLSYTNVQELINQRLDIFTDETQKKEEREKLLNYGRNIIQLSRNYFESHFTSDNAPLREMLDIYKIARLCNPDFIRRKILARNFTAEDIIPDLNFLLTKNIINNGSMNDKLADFNSLIDEMPAYAQQCSDFDLSRYNKDQFIEMMHAIESFWEKGNQQFQNWVKLAQYFMLLQPSSGAAERVFSKLIRILSRPGMDDALNETIETILMLMCNEERDLQYEEDYDIY